MSETAKAERQRYIHIILKNRDENTALSVSEIHQFLKDRENLDVTNRTIRRDLIELSQKLGLCSLEGPPERFYPSCDFEIKHALELDENTLQVLMIALNNLKHTGHQYFHDKATQTEQIILDSLNQKLRENLMASKQRYHYDYSASGKPPATNLKDFENIMYAIRNDLIINCLNASPYKEPEYNQRRRFFAIKLFVLTGSTPYLVALDQQDQQIKKLRMTRLQDVKVTDQHFDPDVIQEKLNINAMFGGWGGIKEKARNIEIICSESVANFFKENVLHKSQKVTEIPNGHYKINLECALSTELSRIIASFGGDIYEVTPFSLLKDVQTIWDEGQKQFKKAS